MKQGTTYRVRVNTRDYRTILDMLDESGVNTEENSDILVGLTLSTLLEVYRQVNLKSDFQKEVHKIRAVWNVPGTSSKQEQVQTQRDVVPMEQWDTLDLLAKSEELDKMKHVPGAEQFQEKIKAILLNRQSK